LARLHAIKINQNAEQREHEYCLKLQNVFLSFQLLMNGKRTHRGKGISFFWLVKHRILMRFYFRIGNEV